MVAAGLGGCGWLSFGLGLFDPVDDSGLLEGIVVDGAEAEGDGFLERCGRLGLLGVFRRLEQLDLWPSVGLDVDGVAVVGAVDVAVVALVPGEDVGEGLCGFGGVGEDAALQ